MIKSSCRLSVYAIFVCSVWLLVFDFVRSKLSILTAQALAYGHRNKGRSVSRIADLAIAIIMPLARLIRPRGSGVFSRVFRI